ncbi:hypothetical protein C9374_011768 [Naegleria lovaniensis]|uniref:Uncharacterized protein n=1 Tax=Naegleria lovaniensis TaxID=51637 RepID=A0AA88GET3_NAELO|nr:uncharacterized protein C9374_011768 [Naegleria lovaniensis]KAG2373883.1 hypothetical protein C9374_011768 [Naegleria lovaniensis]
MKRNLIIRSRGLGLKSLARSRFSNQAIKSQQPAFIYNHPTISSHSETKSTFSNLNFQNIIGEHCFSTWLGTSRNRMTASSDSGKVTSTPFLKRTILEEQFMKLFSSSQQSSSQADKKRSGILLLGPEGCGKTMFMRKMASKIREQDNLLTENDDHHSVVIEFGSCKEWVNTYVSASSAQKPACIHFVKVLLGEIESEHERYMRKFRLMEKLEAERLKAHQSSLNDPSKSPSTPSVQPNNNEENHDDEENDSAALSGLRAAVQVLEAWKEYLQELYNVRDELSQKDFIGSLSKFTNLLSDNTFMKTIIMYDDYEAIFEQPQPNKAMFTIYPFFEAVKPTAMFKNVDFVYAGSEDTNLFKYTSSFRGQSEKHKLMKIGRLTNEEVDHFLESYKEVNESPLLDHPDDIKRVTGNFIGDIVRLLNNYSSFEDYIQDKTLEYETKLVQSIFEERLKQVRYRAQIESQRNLLENNEFADITIENKPFTIGGVTFNNQEEVTMCLDNDRLTLYNNAFDWYLGRNDITERYNSSYLESVLLDAGIWYRVASELGTRYKFRNPMAERVFKQNLANHLYATKFNLHSSRSDRIMSLWSTKATFPKKRNALLYELLARLLEDQSQIIGTVQYTAGKKLELLKEKIKEQESKKHRSKIDELLEKPPTLDMKGLSICLNQPSPFLFIFGRELSEMNKGTKFVLKEGSPPFEVEIFEVSNDATVGDMVKTICEQETSLSKLNVVYPKFSVYNDLDLVVFSTNSQTNTLDVFTFRIVEGNGFGKKPVEFQDEENVKKFASLISSLPKPKGVQAINHHFALLALEKSHTNVKNYNLFMPDDLAACFSKVTISYIEDYFTEDVERISQYASYLKQLEEELEKEQNDELNFRDPNTVEAMMSQMGHKDLPWYDKLDM